MPWAFPSAARACVKPVKPNLEAQYAAAFAQPRLPTTEEMLMMVPRYAWRMWGKTAFANRKGACCLNLQEGR
jgi:hypothetical protein